MEMDERKIKILQAIIDDYIDTAEPVGSRTIAKKYDLGISSATIRNEMSDLEEMGYLVQLHSSSGRIPSDKGYRLYVDKLMKHTDISQEEELMIKNMILSPSIYEMEKAIKQSVLLLSTLTRLTCVVRAPSVRKSFLKSIQLLYIDKLDVLLVVLTDNGVIKNNVIRVKAIVDNEKISKLNDILNVFLKGLTIEEISHNLIVELKDSLKDHEEIIDTLVESVFESLNESGTTAVYLEGVRNIFDYPEYRDIEKAKNFLTLLDDKQNIKSLLGSEQGVSVSIGSENFLDEAKECSIITAVYGIQGRTLGSIGIIGPTRMNYSKTIAILTNFVNELNISMTKNFLDEGKR